MRFGVINLIIKGNKMKIDLHLHTKKTKEDSYSRDISPDEFVKKLKEAEVGIAAITNHNCFYEEQFREIIRLANNDILVLPGIELTVFVNEKNKIKHMNLILDNDDKCVLKLKKFLNDKNIDSSNPVNIQEVINFFDEDEGKVIFYPDKKSSTKERGFSDDEIKELFINNEKFKNVCVLDTNVKGFCHYFRNGVSSLIGSDVKHWDKYVEESKKLINYYTPIFSFQILYGIFKKGDTYENFRRDDLIKEIDNVQLTDKLVLNKVPIITNSMNVIFGSKATGKTTLLKQLYVALNVDENKKFYYEKSLKNDEEDLVSLAKSSPDYQKCYTEFKEIKNNICFAIKKIISYSESLKKNYLHEFYLFYKNIEHNKGKFNIISVKDKEEKEEPSENQSITTIVKSLRNSISEPYSKNEELYKSTTEVVNRLIDEWKKEYLKINYEYFQSKFINKTILKLQEIIKINKNVLPEIKRFGLKEIFEKRLSLNKKIKKLNEIIYDSKNENKKLSEKKINLKTFKFNHEYVVPIENTNDKKTWMIIGYLNLNIKTNTSDKNYQLKQIINYLLNRKYIDFSNPCEVINRKNESMAKESLNDENSSIFKEEYNFVLKDSKDQNMEPSAGEKSYILLKNILSKEEVDWFFIDEPERHLNSQFISEVLLLDIEQLIKKGKTIVITTHNNILGINTNPSNYLLRENIKTNDGVFSTWYGNMASKNMLPLFDGKEEKKNITSILLKYFEGNKDLYMYRNNIYELERDKNGR